MHRVIRDKKKLSTGKRLFSVLLAEWWSMHTSSPVIAFFRDRVKWIGLNLVVQSFRTGQEWMAQKTDFLTCISFSNIGGNNNNNINNKRWCTGGFWTNSASKIERIRLLCAQTSPKDKEQKRSRLLLFFFWKNQLYMVFMI